MSHTAAHAATEAEPALSAGFIEKRPLERYVAPAKPSLVGYSRGRLAEALGGIGVPERQRACACSKSGTGSTCAVRRTSTR